MIAKSKTYLEALKYDFRAAIVVFLVALPLCLGIALGSGAPLFSGIIAGIVGGLVVGSISGSQLSVTGPAAGLTAIVIVGIGKLQAFDAFLLAVVIGGVFQMLLGMLKAGIIGDYFPASVIKGMLACIGLILILKQLPHLVGYDQNFQGDEAFFQQDGTNTLSDLIKSAGLILPGALVIGMVCLIILIIWDRSVQNIQYLKMIPAPLVVVVAGILINALFQQSFPELSLTATHLVTIPVASGDIARAFTFPDVTAIQNPQVWITGFTIAIVASLETLLNIEAADNLDAYKRVTPKNRELKAQGIGNIISGLIGGLPVTSVVVRTSANINAGAKTKMATIMHAMLLLLSVLLMPGILNMIPLSALAAILLYTGYKLAHPKIFQSLYRKGLDQFVPFMVTVLAILFSDLLVGILIGCLVAIFFVIRSNFKSAIFLVTDSNKYLFRLRKDVSFLNKPIIKTKLEEVPPNAYVIIDMARADFVDRDILEVIDDFMKHAHMKNIQVEIKNIGTKEFSFKEQLLTSSN